MKNLLSFAAAALTFIPFADAFALPADCTYSVGGNRTMSFTEVQQLIDNPANPQAVKICFLPNTVVLNTASSASRALWLSKPDYSLFADPGSNVKIRNERPSV